jgi:hypothetical protein
VIRVLQGLDDLKESDRDVQIVVKPDEVIIVTALDEIYIELLEDAEVLRDALDGWIEKKCARIKAGER